MNRHEEPEEVEIGQQPAERDQTLSLLAARLREPIPIPLQVADSLRELILSGKLRPGERLVEWKIARQLGIGQPTIREALVILEAEGLVQRQPNKGCSVISLTLEQIDQIYCVRVELESLAAALAAEKATSEQRSQLRAALKQLYDAATAGDLDRWHLADVAFHKNLWAASGNPFLEKALSHTVTPFFLFAKLVFYQLPPKDLVEQAGLHEQIVEGIEKGDRSLARRITKKVLQEFWELWRHLTKEGSERPAWLKLETSKKSKAGRKK